MQDPLHQFVISPIFKICVGGMDLSFTNSSLAVFTAVAAAFALLALGLRNGRLVPNRLQALVEASYEFITNMIDSNIGKEGRRYFPFVFSIFIFILFGNSIGLVPHMFTFTSHIIATFTLASIVFLFITFLGIALHGFHFFNLFAPSGVPKLLLPILVPVEMMSYLARPVSLSIRLFANMMAGHTMIKIFAGFAAALGIFCGLAPIAVDALVLCLETIIAFLQAYIFATLTCVYINDVVHLH
ncbi:MAG: F0F1 ATP synthase subunit A [Holosporaceae bacterium]|jgi:F-type H+-transporting ATPase subunit a|nr:F0F1 ATP synthase subunit A [Holosporaceae bacterium]